MTAQEIFCIAGLECDSRRVFFSTDHRGKTWYVQQGGRVVNATYDPIEEGTDLDMLYDVDSFTWSCGIDSLEEFENSLL